MRGTIMYTPGEPLHCNNTEHLRHCAQHQCPAMFKCRGTYCIPLHMVCDDVADCQDEEDEIGCHQLECKGLLMVRDRLSYTRS